MIKKIFATGIFFLLLFLSIVAQQPKILTLSRAALKDKIMGGWAGQTIAVTFGGPYEFRFMGTFIQDYQPLAWYDGYLAKTMLGDPGLYDDLYMDLTFVDVFERLGLDAPVDSFAYAFAHAGYMLWHANQAARYNILNGIRPPLSGNWINNPHADDIDYQIESDFAGLMSPGMPNAAAAISDRIGHIMNYGDGWYGGVFVGAMYSLAFVSDSIAHIVDEALQTIPPESKFHQCIADVIRWHRTYPADWHNTWFELQKKWSSDIGCPDGVFDAFDIDAKLNAAYVVMALLYGNGDYTRTLDIAARAGQDADCNPSTAGGVLGAMLGYQKIPAYWKMGLKDAESIDFKYTKMSLEKVYGIGFAQALENIRRNGGKVEDGEEGKVMIRLQEPARVKLEQCFPGMYPILKQGLAIRTVKDTSLNFEGTGFVLRGEAGKKREGVGDYVFNMEMSIDGQRPDTIRLPTLFTTRRHDLCWKYSLPKGPHTVRIKVLNPNEDYAVNTQDYIVYSDHPPEKK